MVGGPAASPSSQQSAEDASPRGSRKISTYGGSRAWSESEEAYLLEARQSKTPYKHIANHLQKTELACRLHFHQLAYGTKRKRRSPSASSVATTQGSRNPSIQATDRGHVCRRSIDSTISKLSTEHQASNCMAPAMHTSVISPPSSPPPAQRRRLARSESPPHMDGLRVPFMSTQSATTYIPSSSTFSPFPVAQSPFPQLPHLNASPFPRPLVSPSAFSNHSFTSAPSLLPPNSFLPHTVDETVSAPNPCYRFNQDLSKDSNSVSASAPPMFGTVRPPSPNSIDPYRLSGIYGRNRHAFWAQISQEYGGNVSPTALEAAFLRQSAGSPTSSLPTPPNRSPVMMVVQIDGDTERQIKGYNNLPTAEGEEADGTSRRGSGESSNDGEERHAGASCSIASLLTEDKDVWQRRRTA